MSIDTGSDVGVYPVSSAENSRISWVAFFICFALVAGGIGATFVFEAARNLCAIEKVSRIDKPLVAAAAAEPLSSAATSSAATTANQPDMNALAPEFGTWLLKHPELKEQTERVQSMMRANQQQIQNLCASLAAVCSQAKGFDSVGACKNRPAQCAQ